MWLAVLHVVPLAIGRSVKARVAPLILARRDDRPDPAAAEVPPHPPIAIRFVAGRALGAPARPAAPGPPHGALFEQRLHEPRIMGLPGAEQEHQGLASAFRTQV